MSQTTYSPRQAAAEFGFTNATPIYDAINSLALPAIRHGGNDGKGGRLLIFHDDIVKWLKTLPAAREAS